ncbi:hypothetical protein ES708_24630 [subsurface metagenome]
MEESQIKIYGHEEVFDKWTPILVDEDGKLEITV